MTYEWARQYLTPMGEKSPSNWRKLLAGALSGAIAQTCTYPLYGTFPALNEMKTNLDSDVLRRRFQINKMKSMGYKYKGIFDAIRIIASQEGFRGFYKGIVPNLLKVAPSMASNFLSFEITRDFLVRMGEDDDS